MSTPSQFTLYWSNLASYEECPQKFLWGRGWGVIDVGGGPGKKKPKPLQKSEHHAIMGIAIQAAIERFYNDELWRHLRGKPLVDRLLAEANKKLELELARKYVDWRLAPPKSEMVETIVNGVRGYLRTMKAHHLLGPYAKAEAELLGYVNQYTPIGGRVDLLIRRDADPTKGVTIIDGKNGKRYKDGKGGLMTYTDPDQLRWYALCFHLAYERALPDRLGFCYYRYPYGDPEVGVDGQPTGGTETGVVWVPFTVADLKGLAERAVNTLKSMDQERFTPTPTPKTCRFCDYDSVCPARVEQKANNTRKPRRDDMPVTVGIETVSLD